jgi:hypothetical protein
VRIDKGVQGSSCEDWDWKYWRGMVDWGVDGGIVRNMGSIYTFWLMGKHAVEPHQKYADCFS